MILWFVLGVISPVLLCVSVPGGTAVSQLQHVGRLHQVDVAGQGEGSRLRVHTNQRSVVVVSLHP